VKRLIVNADDFGLTRGVNRAILECISGGIVTSTTLMANSDEFEDAVGLAKRLVLSQLRSASAAISCLPMAGPCSPGRRKCRSLLAPGSGLFLPIHPATGEAGAGNRFRSEEIEAEALRSSKKIQAAGITISAF